MSKNPKLTIALAFILTFLIGVGAGYLMRGSLQPITEDYQLSEGADRSPGIVGTTPDEHHGRQGWRQDSVENEGERQGQGSAGQAGRVDREERSYGDSERRIEDREGRRSEERELDDRERRGLDRDSESKWQSDSERGRPDYERFRNRIKRDLNLSDEKADELFHVMGEHREAIRGQMKENHQRAMMVIREMKEEFEEEIAELLTEEQWQIWQEKYSPRQEHRNRRGDGNQQR